MSNFFLVTYDIMDPKRWQKVHRTMKGFGQRLQYSVFACELSGAQRVRMVAARGADSAGPGSRHRRRLGAGEGKRF